MNRAADSDPHNRSSGMKLDAVSLANQGCETSPNLVKCPGGAGFIIAAVEINICCKTLNRTNKQISSHLPKQWENSQVIIHICFEKYMTDRQFAV